MVGKRINHNIKSDVLKMGELLSSIREDRNLYLELIKKPYRTLLKHGIPIDKYVSKGFSKDAIVNDMLKVIKSTVQKDYLNYLRGILVAQTSSSKGTSSSMEYNFDHSSSTDYKYESHTGTERGTFSETSRGESTDTDHTFNDIQIGNLENILVGPLISEKGMKTILDNVKQTLNFAAKINQ